jgi:general secretion pathway protein I
MVIGTTVRGTRAIDQKLALSGAAETLLTQLPSRSLLKPGTQTGVLAGHRWRIDVAPLNLSTQEAALTSGFVPLAVSLRMQGPGGAAFQATTVRLVPKAAQ